MVNMASKMLQKFEKYWGEIHGIMGIATILDPRFKVKLLEYYYKDIYGPDCNNKVDKIVTLCRDLIREYQRKYSKQLEVVNPEDTHFRTLSEEDVDEEDCDSIITDV